jgi:hypothetical protein
MGGALAGMGVLVALVVMLGLLTWAPALAIPQPGHYFYGNATIAGTPAPAGTLITAVVVSTTLVYTSTVDNQGRYGYQAPYMVVPADDPGTPEREGATAGDTVEFYVGVSKARLFGASTWWDAYPWASGSTTNLDLNATEWKVFLPVTFRAYGP